MSPVAGRPVDVFWTFLKLGLTSFGGPIAHIGYFRAELVERRRWVADAQFGQLLAICQFLPGPASSQLGFSLGLIRAGWVGGLAAFVAFTLPSALLLVGFAAILPWVAGSAGETVLDGLKLAACAVVADAVWSMSRTLCPDMRRRVMAVLAAAMVLLAASAAAQLVVIALAALVGAVFLRGIARGDGGSDLPVPLGPRTGVMLLCVFALLLLGLPLTVSSGPDGFSMADAFYRAGALVFGGGHVVLPLLQDAVVAPGWVSADEFLAGYGAAQAIPGPMFAFAAYLGAVLAEGEGVLSMATTALIFMFLPGFLLVAGILPFWNVVTRNAIAGRAIAGVNAAVVGVLGAALYDPILTSGVRSPGDAAIAAVGFGLLAVRRMSPLWVVGWCVLASSAAAYLAAS